MNANLLGEIGMCLAVVIIIVYLVERKPKQKSDRMKDLERVKEYVQRRGGNLETMKGNIRRDFPGIHTTECPHHEYAGKDAYADAIISQENHHVQSEPRGANYELESSPTYILNAYALNQSQVHGHSEPVHFDHDQHEAPRIDSPRLAELPAWTGGGDVIDFEQTTSTYPDADVIWVHTHDRVER